MRNLISLSQIRLHCPKFKISKFGQFMAIVFTTLSSTCRQLLRFKFCKNSKFLFLNNNINPLAVTLMLFDKFKVVNWCNFEMGIIPVFFCKLLAPYIPNSFKFWQMSKFLNHRWRMYSPSKGQIMYSSLLIKVNMATVRQLLFILCSHLFTN